ncbi:hypothetical protein HET69_34720, partial [Streptomyces sp. CJ_13]|uniref:hypothetical protein n=1 Tax=Streptomyces sp. CJ_13 TaxID=2724943 RepID=UPI001BDCBF7E
LTEDGHADTAVSGPPATLVPEDNRAAWSALWAAHAAGDLPTAVVLAHRLEVQLEAEYGPSHPDTITVLSARAWLTLIQRTDPRGTAELLITTALRRQAARARSELETARAARNAHAVWRNLRDQDPEGAREMAEPLADRLAILGEDVRRRDVLDWTAAVPTEIDRS